MFKGQQGGISRVVSLLALCAALSGCGMRSVLDGYSDGLPPAADAGALGAAGAAGATTKGAPCGHRGKCDPTNLDGETCDLLGAGSGTLACDPVTCTFDLSMCGGAPIATGTGTGPNVGRGGNGGAAGQTGGFMNGGQGGTGAGGGLFGGGGTAGTGGLFGGGGTAGTGGLFGGGGTAGRGGRGGRGGAGTAGRSGAGG